MKTSTSSQQKHTVFSLGTVVSLAFIIFVVLWLLYYFTSNSWIMFIDCTDMPKAMHVMST